MDSKFSLEAQLNLFEGRILKHNTVAGRTKNKLQQITV